MALWRVLAGADRRCGSESLDMLLFLKQNPHVRAQWTHFIQELSNKCADLQIPVELFRKSPSLPSESQVPDAEQTAIGESGGDIAADAAASDKQDAIGDAMSGQVTTRVNWIELCFYLAVQLQAATGTAGTTNSSGRFPISLAKKQRELWKKKKIKLILDVFASCCELAGVCCVYDGIRELKNGEVKWVFLCDLFLSELQEIQAGRWIELKNNKAGNTSNSSQSASDCITSEDIAALLERLAHTPLGAGISSINTCDEAELVAALGEITKRVLSESAPTAPTSSKERLSTSNTEGVATTESPSSANGMDLNADEMEKLQLISSILRDDYQTRREMMLERCDVTLRSFERSKKLQEVASRAQEMKDELATARAKLTSTPVEVNVERLLATGVSEELQRAKLSAEELHIGSSVQHLLIGPVPDRGGRANDNQAKEMQKAKHGSWNISKPRTLNNESSRKAKPTEKKKKAPEDQAESTETEAVPVNNKHQQETQQQLQQSNDVSNPKKKKSKSKKKNKPQNSESAGDPSPPAIAA